MIYPPDTKDVFDGVLVEYMIIPVGKERHQIFIDRATFDNVIKELPLAIANYKRYRVKYPKRKS